MCSCRVLDVAEEGARLCAQRSVRRVDVQNLVHVRQVKHDATLQRHSLSVVSRSRSTRHNGHAVRDRRPHGCERLVFTSRHGERVPLASSQRLLEYG